MGTPNSTFLFCQCIVFKSPRLLVALETSALFCVHAFYMCAYALALKAGGQSGESLGVYVGRATLQSVYAYFLAPIVLGKGKGSFVW